MSNMPPQIRPGHFLREDYRHPHTPTFIRKLAEKNPSAASLADKLYKQKQAKAPKSWWEKSPLGNFLNQNYVMRPAIERLATIGPSTRRLMTGLNRNKENAATTPWGERYPRRFPLGYFLTSQDRAAPEWVPKWGTTEPTDTSNPPHTWRNRLIGAGAIAYGIHQIAMGGFGPSFQQTQQHFATELAPIKPVILMPDQLLSKQFERIAVHGAEDIKTTWRATAQSAPAIVNQMHKNDMTRLNRDVIPTAQELGKWVKQQAIPVIKNLKKRLIDTQNAKAGASRIRERFFADKQHLNQVGKSFKQGISQTLGRG
jgi:hypothetical protein